MLYYDKFYDTPKLYDVYDYAHNVGMVRCCGMVMGNRQVETHVGQCDEAEAIYGKGGNKNLSTERRFLLFNEEPKKPFCDNFELFRYFREPARFEPVSTDDSPAA